MTRAPKCRYEGRAFYYPHVYTGWEKTTTTRFLIDETKILHTWTKLEAQASATRYFLRVVTIVTSVTVVPSSSCSADSTCLVWEDSPVMSTSFEGMEPESVPVGDCKVRNGPSTFTGIRLQIRRGRRSSSNQVPTYKASNEFSSGSPYDRGSLTLVPFSLDAYHRLQAQPVLLQ